MKPPKYPNTSFLSLSAIAGRMPSTAPGPAAPWMTPMTTASAARIIPPGLRASGSSSPTGMPSQEGRRGAEGGCRELPFSGSATPYEDSGSVLSRSGSVPSSSRKGLRVASCGSNAWDRSSATATPYRPRLNMSVPTAMPIHHSMESMNPSSASTRRAMTTRKTHRSPTLCPAPHRTPNQKARVRVLPHARDATALRWSAPVMTWMAPIRRPPARAPPTECGWSE